MAAGGRVCCASHHSLLIIFCNKEPYLLTFVLYLLPVVSDRSVYLLMYLSVISLHRHVVFADPTQEEEDLVKGAVTIVTMSSEETCIIHKPSMLLYTVCLKVYAVKFTFCLYSSRCSRRHE